MPSPNLPPEEQPKVKPFVAFISYSRKDIKFVERLSNELEHRDRKAWVDLGQIPPGDKWENTIYKAIEGTNAFIFVLTPDSVTSKVAEKELAHAVANNKRVVPVVYRDVKADLVPKSLAELNWIFCRENDDFQKAIDTVISALDTDIEWVRAHTRLLTRAIEWKAKGKNSSFVLRGDDLKAAEQWLAQAGSDKERQPTALQTEYIIFSRKAAARRLRVTLGAVAFGAVVAIVLAILAWNQRTKALDTLSRSYFEQGCRLIDEDRAPVALAFLARAIQSNPKNRVATIRLLALIVERNWILPLTEPLPHDFAVVSVRFSPDDSKLLTEQGGLGSFGEVRIWDVTTGKPLSPPLQQEYWFTHGRFSPRSLFVTTFSNRDVGEEGPRANVWHTDGTPIAQQIEAQTSRFVIDDEHLAVGVNSGGSGNEPKFQIDDGSKLLGTDSVARSPGPIRNSENVTDIVDLDDVQLWLIGSQIQRLKLPVEPGVERFVGFSSSGATFLKVTGDDTLVLCDTLDYASSVSLRKRSGSTTAFFADEETVVTLIQEDDPGAAQPKPVQLELWAASSGSRLGGCEIGTNAGEKVTSLALNAAKTEAIIAVTMPESEKARSSLARLDLVQSRELWRLALETRVHTAFLCPNEKDLILFTGAQNLVSDNPYDEWSIWGPSEAAGNPVEKLHSVSLHGPGSEDDQFGFALYTPERQIMVSATRSRGLRFWNAQRGPQGCRPLTEALLTEGEITNACFSKGRRVLATGSRTQGARIWNSDLTACQTWPFATKGLGPVSEPLMEVPGLKIMPGDDDEPPVVADSAGKELWKVTPPCSYLKSVSFDRTGTFLIAVGYEKERPTKTIVAMLYEAKTGKEKAGPLRLTGQTEIPGFATLSNDQRLVAIVAGGRVFLWDVTRPAPWVPFRQFDHVESETFVEVSISPNNQLLLARTSDDELLLWDIATGRRLTDKQVAPSGSKASSSGDYSQVWRLFGCIGPAPEWLPQLAEAIGGFKLDDTGVVPTVARDRSLILRRLEAKFSAQGGDDLYSKFGRWFFEERKSRNISPLVQARRK